MTNGGVDIQLDARDLRKVMKMAKDFSPELGRQLRKQLRAAGQIGANVSKEAILAMPSKGEDEHALRQKIARAIKVSVVTSGSANAADIRISVQRTAELNQAGLGGIAKAINKGRWRHPVYAKRDSARYKNPKLWVNQSGPEFFDHRIEEVQPAMEALALEALKTTVDIIVAQGET